MLDVDQFGLFADESFVIEVPARPARDAVEKRSSPTPAERRRAVGVLKSLSRVIERFDVPEEQKTCPCCGERMSPFGHESCEQLHYCEHCLSRPVPSLTIWSRIMRHGKHGLPDAIEWPISASKRGPEPVNRRCDKTLHPWIGGAGGDERAGGATVRRRVMTALGFHERVSQHARGVS